MNTNLKNILTPYKTNFTKKRYGCNWDSGYIYLSELFDKSEIIYSYGLDKTEEAISFDIDAAELGKKIFMYDASIDSPAVMKQNFFFKKEFLTSENFKRHIEENGHESETNMILKMDIEGAEYSIVPLNIDLINKHFSQVSIEIHNTVSSFRESSYLINCLNKFYKIFHIHGNNHDFIYDEIPNCIEISLVRNDYNVIGVEDKAYPLDGIDFPNAKDKKDYTLDWWTKK
jgi:hypothetical protein